MKKIFTLLFFAIFGLNNTNAATFSSVATGTWTAPATWSVTGFDADGIPDSDDDVTVNAGHVVTLSSSSINFFKSLVVQSGATLTGSNGSRLGAYGNFTVQGTITGSYNFYVLSGCVCNFSSANTLTSWGLWVYGTLNILAGTSISSGSGTVYSTGVVNQYGNYTGTKNIQTGGVWNDYSSQGNATFISIQTGNWGTSTTWSITSGSDADGIPDSNDDVTVKTGHTVTFSNLNYFKSLLVQSGATVTGTNGSMLYAYGNFTIQGTISGLFNFYVGSGNVSNFSINNVITGWGFWISGTLNILSGTNINSGGVSTVYPSGKINNAGNYQGTISLQSTGTWLNQSASTLTLTSVNGLSNNADFSSNPNTVIYSTNGGNIYPTTYYNLTLNSPSTKTLSSNLTVLNNINIASGSNNKLNANNFNINVAGNWTNNANTTILSQGTITFNGSGTQTITRSTSNEVIDKMVVGGTGTVLLGSSINVSTSLNVNSGTLDVSASNYTVNVGGTLTNNATINPRSGLFNFNGSSAQTINGSTNTQFYNLTLNNAAGLTINSAQSLKNILTVTSGNFNSNGNFTLLSDGTSTGIIGTSAGSFSGSMTIQKHISARAANYHDLSSPVQSTTIMDWDDDLYMSGIGPYDGIVGPAGVDGGVGGNSSVWSWHEPTGSWTAVTGSTYPIVSGNAYEIYIADNTTTWAARAIDTKGTPTFGAKNVSLTYNAGAGAYAGLNLVGNPYAASVNYSACTKTNITGNVLILDNSGNYTDYGSSPVIPPHQGFWVTAGSGGGTLGFTEASKSNTTATSFYRIKPNYGIKLIFSSAMLPFYNENTVNFAANASLNYDDNLDALYLKSPNKNAPAIYMLADNNAKLITNTISSDLSEVSIPLGIYTPKQGIYNIEPSVLNTNDYSYTWIENIKTGEKYSLNSTITLTGEENKTNLDYVLRLSKKSANTPISQSIFNDDVIVFTTENTINLKSNNNTNHNISQVAVYDVSGKLLIEESNINIENGNAIKIDISALAKGVYIVNVIDTLGHKKNQKIIH